MIDLSLLRRAVVGVLAVLFFVLWQLEASNTRKALSIAENTVETTGMCVRDFRAFADSVGAIGAAMRHLGVRGLEL